MKWIKFEKWIKVSFSGWAGSFVVVSSYLGVTSYYFGKTLKEAERLYRESNGLTGQKLSRIKD